MKIKDLFGIENQYSKGKKYKVIKTFGVKTKIKVKKKGLNIPLNVQYSTVHYFIALLKAYGIKYIVSSPGTQNAAFNLFIQEDNYFKTYSVVDERSAVYVATGIAFETGEPVVVTCTEATASRNWLSGLTEAFYRKLPIIACSFFNEGLNRFSLSPQYSDRSVTQNDIKRMFVELPVIHNGIDKQKCLTLMNAAFTTAIYRKEPIHINCPSLLNIPQINTVKSLPKDIWFSEIYEENFGNVTKELLNKKVAIFIGSHHKFDRATEEAISNFAKNKGIPVLVDHTSNYHGANRLLVSQVAQTINKELYPDVIIDLGNVSGEYVAFPLLEKGCLWRISPDREFHSRCNRAVKKLFYCSEKYFFELLANENNKSDYFETLKGLVKNSTVPNLPFSLPYIAKGFSTNIPKDSTLNLAILNSLRSMNYFDLDPSIDIVCNVGGFGIDGACSTLVGTSLANRERKCFGLIGDLAFFYDMNILGNRHLSKNIRILLVNNNKGAEFHVSYIGQIENKRERLDNLVAASGHYVNGAKDWATSCGFKYMKATNKTEFDINIKDFCNEKSESPILFECFTNSTDEDEAIKLLQRGNNE